MMLSNTAGLPPLLPNTSSLRPVAVSKPSESTAVVNSHRSTSAGEPSERSLDAQSPTMRSDCADGMLAASKESADIFDADLAECCPDSEQMMPAMRTSAPQASKPASNGSSSLGCSSTAGGSSARSLDGVAQSPAAHMLPRMVSSQESFDHLDAELADCCEEAEQTMPAMRTSAAQACKPDAKLIVRNTFIDEPVGRPASLDGFFIERVVRSCPASRQHSAQTEQLHDIIDDSAQGYMTDDGEGEGVQSIDGDTTASTHPTLDAESIAGSSDLLSKLRSNGTNVLEKLNYASLTLGLDPSAFPGGASSGLDWDWFSFPADAQAWSQEWSLQWPPPMEQQGTALSLDAILQAEGYFSNECGQLSPPAPWAPQAPMQFDVPLNPPPELPPQADLQKLPSVGSALHASGQCKPCWFIHKRGCTNGEHCTLCHLCPPGEWKRRRAARRNELEKAALAADASSTAGEEKGDSDIMGLLKAAFSRNS